METIIIENKCSNCGEILTEDNWSGWFDLETNEFGIVVRVPVCNECNLSDDDISGAY